MGRIFRRALEVFFFVVFAVPVYLGILVFVMSLAEWVLRGYHAILVVGAGSVVWGVWQWSLPKDERYTPD